jgi:hypothetical protein
MLTTPRVARCVLKAKVLDNAVKNALVFYNAGVKVVISGAKTTSENKTTSPALY